MPLQPPAAFINLAEHTLEYAWFEPAPAGAMPTALAHNTHHKTLAPIVLLHEGLGCVAMWKNFPQQVANLTGRRVLTYSRAGYGQSSPAKLPRSTTFMHHEAWQVLPELLITLKIQKPLLLGHSDGGSIALLYASQTKPSKRFACQAVIVIAPHVFVEEVTLNSIQAAQHIYANSEHPAQLRARLARYHADVDHVFRGWNDVWLNRAFRTWNIEAEVAQIECPILAIQGIDDPYGSMLQIEKIETLLKAQSALKMQTMPKKHARAVFRHDTTKTDPLEAAPRVELLKLADCQHSPHLEKPQETLAAIAQFCAHFN